MSNRTNMIKMGNHIADLRKKKKYTQKTLGDILDVSDKTVSKWEKGVVAPDITILQLLASTLDSSVEEILAGEEVQKINTIEALNIYSNMTKNRLIKAFLICILLLCLIIFFVFRIEEYYSWHLTNIFSKGDISSLGYILSNNKRSKVLVNKMIVNDNINNMLIKKVNIKSKNNEEVIYDRSITFDTPINIKETLNNCIINIEVERRIKKKDLDFLITFVDTNDYHLSYKFNFD